MNLNMQIIIINIMYKIFHYLQFTNILQITNIDTKRHVSLQNILLFLLH